MIHVLNENYALQPFISVSPNSENKLNRPIRLSLTMFTMAYYVAYICTHTHTHTHTHT